MTKPVGVLYEIHPHILGGTERFLSRFLERLDPNRFQPIVISPKNGPPLQMIRSAGLQTEVMPDYFRLTGIRRLAEFVRSSGVALTQSNYYSAHLAMASNLARVPHVWRLGGHLDFASGARNNQQTQSKLETIRLLSSAIICNSRYVRSQFRSSTHPPIQVIPNGISVPDRASPKKRIGNFHVGMIAHFAPQKRHLDFIRAAEIVCEQRDDVAFSIVGGEYADAASRRYSNLIKGKSSELQRRGKLSISQFVKADNHVLDSFDMVVLPSLYESFSNAILEAMAAGIPVIAARSGGTPELVKHGKTGVLTPPMCPAAISEAVLRMVSQPALINRMGRAARRRAQTHFSVEKCVKSYETIYSKVLLTP